MTFPAGRETAKLAYQKGEVQIIRFVGGYAYPRNGNTHNPTPRYYWVTYRTGRALGVSNTLKAAKELADY